MDPATGAPLVKVASARALAGGGSVVLEGATLTSWGEGLLEVRSPGARSVLGELAVLAGGVEAVWRGRGTLARLRSIELVWDDRARSLRTSAAVSGELVGDGDLLGSPATPAGEAAPPSGLRLELSGLGLVAVHQEGRLSIEREAELVLQGLPDGPWLAVADGGLEIEGLGGARPLVRLEGPIAAASKGISARAEAAELHLRAERGALVLARAYATGLVSANVTAPDGLVEIRAEAVELAPSEGCAVLLGTPVESASARFSLGEIRGLRIEVRRGRVSSDGGALSKFSWGNE